MKKQRRLAIFDIDGTLVRGSLLISLIEGLIEEGVFPLSARKIFSKEKALWETRKGTYSDYIECVIDSFLMNIKGVSYEDVLAVSKKVAKENKDKVYIYTKSLIFDLKKKGYYVLAISNSPKIILDIFCKDYGFDKIYGRFYEIGPNDRFTGEITDLHLIGNKANIVKRVLEKEGLSLDGSIGVGDTESDIPFLELVSEPICFNPNSGLYKHARRQKWKIFVERKDMIYDISK